MRIPKARGALSAALFQAMRAGADEVPVGLAPDSDEDAQIALWALYELHYRGFDDAPDDLEWHPGLLAVRRELERDLEERLRARFVVEIPDGPFEEAFFEMVAADDGPSTASYVHRHADREQVLELLRQRSVYHLKEADPTAWVVPRLPVETKAALMELQYDEYGCGDPNRLHSHLFGEGLVASGLSAEYGAYVDEATVEVLEQNNAMSLFGLHRRHRAAALGHLAAFEATSSMPSRRMAQGLARLEFPRELIGYYDEHVAADAVHEQLAVRTICGSLVRNEPALVSEVYFGAFTCLDLEARFARSMLSSWQAEERVAS
ncbi:MAG: iron-containing redox enzyme family protein, partial [Nocardioides sp.]|nr:iron-containing redox enzyme family protein [Nocardioides sp.]